MPEGLPWTATIVSAQTALFENMPEAVRAQADRDVRHVEGGPPDGPKVELKEVHDMAGPIKVVRDVFDPLPGTGRWQTGARGAAQPAHDQLQEEQRAGGHRAPRRGSAHREWRLAHRADWDRRDRALSARRTPAARGTA